MITFDDTVKEYRQFKHMEQRLNLDMERRISRIEMYWKNILLKNITTKAITDWSFYMSKKNLKPNTIKRELNQFKAILKYYERVNDYKCPHIQMPRVNDERDCHLEGPQASAVLRYVADKHPSFYPHFLILIDTGARLNEMLNVNTSSFSNGNTLKIQRQHFGKTIYREIPLTDDMIALRDKGFSKLNCFNSPQSASATLGKIMKEACHNLGLEQIRLHDLRHTFAYLTAKAGADLGDLKYLMGHADISMTLRYRGFIPSRASSSVRSAR
tara:strand:- start:674 stop:1483 length:810 start_codon:yes stop_codon:yes gene_type:complete